LVVRGALIYKIMYFTKRAPVMTFGPVGNSPFKSICA
jgi:hypothetical protein